MRSHTVVMLFALLLIAGGAMAQPPQGAQECSVWFWSDSLNDWVPNNQIEPEERNGRLFRSGEEWLGNCNKEQWSQDFTIHASVAHWIDFRLAWTRWDWFIRKPGTYAGDGIEAWIKSNGDVSIDFDGFADLQPDEPGANPLAVHYSYTTGSSADISQIPYWYTPEDLNAETVVLDDIENNFALHYGVAWFLWSKIHVIECNSSCEYENVPTITLTLSQQKDWIHFPTGNWWDSQLP